jgi:acyl carrier protein
MSDQNPKSDVRFDEATLRQMLVKIILELAPEARGQPNMQTHLVEEMGYHSLALLELAFSLEDEFNLEPLEEAAARKIHTVGDVIEYVVNEMRERGSIAETAAHP